MITRSDFTRCYDKILDNTAYIILLHIGVSYTLHPKISATFTYPLLACALIETECKNNMHKSIKAALPRARFALNVGIQFRDRPIGSLGAGVLSLYSFMGT